MEQRKRIPTGTFNVEGRALPTAEALRKRLHTGETVVGRTRHFTGEYPVKNAPPPAPGERPVLAALGSVGEVLSTQVEHQHNVEVAVLQMAQRYQQLEHAVLRASGFHSDLSRDAIEAVRQGNMLHEQTNQLLLQAAASMHAITHQLNDFTRALQHNSHMRRQTADSWIVHAVYWCKRQGLGVNAVVFASLGFLLFAVLEYVSRQP